MGNALVYTWIHLIQGYFYFSWTKKLSSSSFSVELRYLKYLQSKLGNNFPFCQCLLFSVLNESSLQTAKLIEPPPFQLKKHSALPKHIYLCTQLHQWGGPELGEIIVFGLNARCRIKRFFFLICSLLGRMGADIWRAYFTLLRDIFLGSEVQRMSSSEKWLAQGYRQKGCCQVPAQVVSSRNGPSAQAIG